MNFVQFSDVRLSCVILCVTTRELVGSGLRNLFFCRQVTPEMTRSIDLNVFAASFGAVTKSTRATSSSDWAQQASTKDRLPSSNSSTPQGRTSPEEAGNVQQEWGQLAEGEIVDMDVVLSRVVAGGQPTSTSPGTSASKESASLLLGEGETVDMDVVLTDDTTLGQPTGISPGTRASKEGASLRHRVKERGTTESRLEVQRFLSECCG